MGRDDWIGAETKTKAETLHRPGELHGRGGSVFFFASVLVVKAESCHALHQGMPIQDEGWSQPTPECHRGPDADCKHCP